MICKCGWDMRKQKFELQEEEEVFDFRTHNGFVLRQGGERVCPNCFTRYNTMFRAEVVDVASLIKEFEESKIKKGEKND